MCSFALLTKTRRKLNVVRKPDRTCRRRHCGIGVDDRYNGGPCANCIGARDINGDVDIYFTADIDFNGTSSATDDFEGYFRLTASTATGCLKGDANQDTLVNTADIPDFVNALLTGSGACESDVNDDGNTDGLDLAQFITCVINGGC